MQARCTRNVVAGVDPGPVDERKLEGKAEPGGPERDGGEAGVLGDHGEVGGEDSDEQEDEAPGGGAAGGGKQDAEAAQDLCGAAEEDEFAVGGEVRRHDAGVGAGEEEVEGSGGDVEGSHDEAA